MADMPARLNTLLEATIRGRLPTADEALPGLLDAPAAALMPTAEALTLAGFGASVTYSRKVFIPLTRLCRDVCHYCTFAKAPRHLSGARDGDLNTWNRPMGRAPPGARAGCWLPQVRSSRCSEAHR